MPRLVTGVVWGVLLVVACIPAAAPSQPASPGLTTTLPPPTAAATPLATAAPTQAPTAATPPGSVAPATPIAAPSATTTAPPPSALTWTELAANGGPAAREDHTWTVAGDGTSAYLFGGRAGRAEFNDLWRYDLASDEWTELEPTGTPPAPRFGHTAVWREGVGLVIWSGQAGPDFFADIWAYEPGTDAWRELPPAGDVPPARYGSCAGVGPDGRMWISHGFTADTGRFSDTRAYDFATESWSDLTPEGDRPVERCLHDCLWTPDGRLLVYAGQTTGAPAIGDLWTYDPAGASWSQAPSPEPPARQLYALAQLQGRAFVFGGGAADGTALGDLWLLDLADLSWSEAAPAGASPTARFGATLIADESRDRLLLFGGKGGDAELADLWELAPAP